MNPNASSTCYYIPSYYLCTPPLNEIRTEAHLASTHKLLLLAVYSVSSKAKCVTHISPKNRGNVPHKSVQRQKRKQSSIHIYAQ